MAYSMSNLISFDISQLLIRLEVFRRPCSFIAFPTPWHQQQQPVTS